MQQAFGAQSQCVWQIWSKSEGVENFTSSFHMEWPIYLNIGEITRFVLGEYLSTVNSEQFLSSLVSNFIPKTTSLYWTLSFSLKG